MELGAGARLRIAFALACLGIPLVYLGGIQALLGIALFGGIPLVPYVLGVRTMAGSVILGVALLALFGWTQWYVDSRIDVGSSTAGVGYLYIPFYGAPPVLLWVVAEQMIRFLGRKSRQ